MNYFSTVRKWHIAFVMNCNLSCSYCITRSGTFGGKPATMSPAVQQRFIELLGLCDHSVELEFGTGETMLAFDAFLNFVDMIRKARSHKGIRDSIIVATNGTLLSKERIDLLLSRGVSLIFSIDGDKHVHRLQRANSAGRSFHDTIMENYHYYLERLDEARIHQMPTVMGVVTEQNSLARMFQFWEGHSPARFSISLALPSNYADNDEMLKYQAVQKQYLIDLGEIALQKARTCSLPGFLNEYTGPLEIFHGWNSLFLEKKPLPCGIFKKLLAVSCSGDLFPCELFLNSPEMKLGNTTGGIDMETFNRHAEDYSSYEKQCRNCILTSDCQAACYVQRYNEKAGAGCDSSCNFAMRVQEIIKQSYDVLNNHDVV